MARENEGVWYRASKDGWYLTVEGKAVSLRVKGERNKAEAITAWHRLMGNPKAQEAPRKPAEPKVKASASLTVGGLLDAFLSSLEAAPNTVRVYKHFCGIFKEKHAEKMAGAIRPHDAEVMATGRGWADSTRHAFLSVLSAGFKWGERAGLLPSNPLLHIRRPALESRGKDAALTAEQHAKLVEAANPAFADLLRVLWATGCRPGEASRLMAQDVDFTTGVAVLAQHKARKKTGKPRIIVIPPEALALLRRMADKALEPDAFLASNPERHSWGGAINTEKATDEEAEAFYARLKAM